jgi:hypothetical protein
VEQFNAVGDAGLRQVLLFVRGSSAPIAADDAAGVRCVTAEYHEADGACTVTLAFERSD